MDSESTVASLATLAFSMNFLNSRRDAGQYDQYHSTVIMKSIAAINSCINGPGGRNIQFAISLGGSVNIRGKNEVACNREMIWLLRF